MLYLKMFFNSIDAALIQIFVQAQDALEDVVVIVDVVFIQFFQAQDVLEDVIVIVAIVHINKEFFFGFIILFTFQAQDALEDVVVIVDVVLIQFFSGPGCA